MSKHIGHKDTDEVKRIKSEAAKERWAKARKAKLDLEKPTIESCINFLYDKAKECRMELGDFVDGYASIMFQRK